MRRIRLMLLALPLMIILVSLVFIACGGGGTTNQDLDLSMESPQIETNIPTQESDDPVDLANSIADNKVILIVPALNDLSAGDEFTALVSVDTVEDVHQGVLRLIYDASSMTPVSVEPGEVMPSDMLRIGDLDNSGFLPLAFTALPGAANIRPGKGELFRIRFRLETEGRNSGRIRFRSDREFLQLRNRDGRHIGFEVETRAGGRDVE